MKQGSLDIPAIQFLIVTGDFMDENGKPDYEKPHDVRIYKFEQLDGLTIKQILDCFNNKDYSHGMELSAYLDLTNYYHKEKKLDETLGFSLWGIRISAKKLNENLNLEFSEFIENLYMEKLSDAWHTCENGLFTREDIVGTFCTRYRGKNKEYVKSKLKN